jgi:hypothetical protein
VVLVPDDDQEAPRGAVNPLLNADPVAKAWKALDEVVTALNGFHEQHGFLSDEFSRQ